MFRVWVYQDAVQLGYKLSVEEKRRQTLHRRVREYRLELASERSPARLEWFARQLKLVRPTAEDIFGIGSGGRHGTR